MIKFNNFNWQQKYLVKFYKFMYKVNKINAYGHDDDYGDGDYDGNYDNDDGCDDDDDDDEEEDDDDDITLADFQLNPTHQDLKAFFESYKEIVYQKESGSLHIWPFSQSMV